LIDRICVTGLVWLGLVCWEDVVEKLAVTGNLSEQKDPSLLVYILDTPLGLSLLFRTITHCFPHFCDSAPHSLSGPFPLTGAHPLTPLLSEAPPPHNIAPNPILEGILSLSSV